MKGDEDQLTTFIKGNWGTCMNSIHASIPEWIFQRGRGGSKNVFLKREVRKHDLLP